MKVIIFTMKNGQKIDFATLSGMKNPEEGKLMSLKETAEVAKIIDDHIVSYEIKEIK